MTARTDEPFLVEATRGGVVEARHRVHAVAASEGRTLLAAGDPGLVAFLRSAAKPIQALPLVRARPELGDREIAIACASHLARPEQLDAVRALLAAAPADASELETGPEPTPLEHNCSGKHAGFLALCRSRGWPSSGYRLADHPCQLAMLAEVAAAAEVDAATVPVAVDGCGVPTFALPLERMAHAFARLPGLEGGARTLAAMRAHPDLIRGPRAADSMLMLDAPGWTAKGGAEGLLCAVSPDGVGLALKVEDGATRALAAALAEVVRRLGGTMLERLAVTPVENSRGERVGELRLSSAPS
ncbi:MAG TPA: asparaginase [Gaiellaceae bacterium]|nr:asparaginase [Gaiellaceae bacterium]